MAGCDNILSINPTQGTTQQSRVLQALQADYFSIEERTLSDFLFYAQKLSNHLKYFNLQNQEDGDWSPFFQFESVSVLVYISKFEPAYSEKILILKKDLALLAEEQDKKDLTLAFFHKVNEEVKAIYNKISFLDNEIAAKEFFEACRASIELLLNNLLHDIENASDTVKKLEEFSFHKTWQQLLGILFNWKTKSIEQIDMLLNSYASHKPHFTLFLAFLKLLRHSIDDMNLFTRRHLDFYYRDVLNLKPKAAEPDFVHLIIEPASDTPFELPANTIFPAKKNTQGQSKFYASLASQAFNASQVKKILCNSVKNDLWYKADLSALNASGDSFKPFPAEQVIVPALLLTHPVLFMQGGERIITIKFDGAPINHLLYDYYVTSEKAFVKLSESFATEDKIVIPASEKAIVCYDAKIHQELWFSSEMPVLKMVLKKGISLVKFKKLSIQVKVNNSKNFLVSTDTGETDISKPFKPFGDFPTNGSSMVLACNEFFAKSGAVVTLKLDTRNMPGKNKITGILSEKAAAKVKRLMKDGFDRMDYRTSFSLKDITEFEYLKNGRWVLIKENDKSGENFIYKNGAASAELATDKPFSAKTSSAGLRLRLDHSSFAGQTFLNKYIKAAKATIVKLPEPATIYDISINYTVEAVLYEKTFKTLQLKENQASKQTHCFVCTAFGYKPYTASGILPDKGEILIGLEKAESNRAMSILFQMQEGTSNPLNEPAIVKWFYLSDNVWNPFPAQQITDDTLGLQQSGIVRFTVPVYSKENTIVSETGLCWIKISVSDLSGICNIYGIHTQAVKAILYDYENAGVFFTENTAKQTIGEVLHTGGEIKKVSQPYNSFGGVLKEDDSLMNRRVSERLRHKQRAITGWDYERLVLEKFPEVYKVKTLNHYRYDIKSISSVAAGYTTLIIIAQSVVNENPIEWKPMPGLSLMRQIADYLRPFQSSHVRIQLKPPMLDEIRIKCKVKYRLNPGDDALLLTKKLNEALNQFISPWAFASVNIDFVQKMESSGFVQFIDILPYVDFVSELELFQDGIAVKEIVPKTDYSLFKPALQHQIIEIKEHC